MRLICPNCGAQYEVDPSMIPADGRDVQCSNCVTTWFQPGAGSAEAVAEQTNGAAPATPDEPAPARTPRRRETSSEALDIIRQEAAREARMREAEALETQEEMPLDAPDDAVERGRQARAQIAELTRPEPEVEAAPQDVAPPPEPPRQAVAKPEPEPEESVPNSSRRDLLPDIEEINSTLHPDEIKDAAEAEALLSDHALRVRGEQRTGRRVGFVLSITIAVVAVVLYVLAPVIAERVPAMAAALEGYVTWVNAVRVQINDLFEGMATSLAGMTQG